MTDAVKAREMWAALAAQERKKILAALDADEVLHDHDWAGLPPQVHSGIIGGMPVEPAAEEAQRPSPRKPKKDDD
jgi:hypothetical protein